jgi:hypothetical protein
MYFAYGFSRMLLIAGFFIVLVSAKSLSASASTALRHNKILRIRGGGEFHAHEAAHGPGSFKDVTEIKKDSSESLMSFTDVEVASPHPESNSTKKIKVPYQYYF